MAAREYAPAAERARVGSGAHREDPRRRRPGAHEPRHAAAGLGAGRHRAGQERGRLLRPSSARSSWARCPSEEARIDAALGAAKKAYADYARFLEHDALAARDGRLRRRPGALRVPAARGLLPRGETPTRSTTSGKRVFDATSAQMDAVARAHRPQGEVVARGDAQAQGEPPDGGRLLPSYRREVAARAAVPRRQGRRARSRRATTARSSRRRRSCAATTTASYEPAPAARSRDARLLLRHAGRPHAATPKQQEEMLRENDHGDKVDTVVHETYPGHHLQLSFARGNPRSSARSSTPSAPVVGSDIFAEGWGLYAEELMGELGYYTDEERLMQLEWTLVRAARVLIDVGLHTRGMTFDEAVKMLTDQVHLEHELAVSEVKRYTMTPTQPLSYLVGRERILAMRERFKQKMGSAFTLKAFHAARALARDHRAGARRARDVRHRAATCLDSAQSRWRSRAHRLVAPGALGRSRSKRRRRRLWSLALAAEDDREVVVSRREARVQRQLCAELPSPPPATAPASSRSRRCRCGRPPPDRGRARFGTRRARPHRRPRAGATCAETEVRERRARRSRDRLAREGASRRGTRPRTPPSGARASRRRPRRRPLTPADRARAHARSRRRRPGRRPPAVRGGNRAPAFPGTASDGASSATNAIAPRATTRRRTRFTRHVASPTSAAAASAGPRRQDPPGRQAPSAGQAVRACRAPPTKSGRFAATSAAVACSVAAWTANRARTSACPRCRQPRSASASGRQTASPQPTPRAARRRSPSP